MARKLKVKLRRYARDGGHWSYAVACSYCGEVGTPQPRPAAERIARIHRWQHQPLGRR
jgi:hypothetical protein